MKKVFSLFLAVVFFFLVPVFPQKDVSEYEERLQKIALQINDLKSKILEEEKAQSTLLSKLDRIGLKKKLIRKEISLYNLQLEKANSELISIKKRIPSLKAKLEREKKSIEKILITLYKFGEFNFLEFILQARDVKTLFFEGKNLTLLAQHQDRVVSDYLNTLDQLSALERNQRLKTEEIAELIHDAQQKQSELEDQENKNRALIEEIEKNKKTHLQALKELRERAQQLQNLIKELVKVEKGFPFPFVPLYERKGELPWPLEGKIVTNFGLQRHKIFKTVTLNNGIEVAPNKNMTIIKAVHSGKVVYADHFKGYGNLIIVDHGMTYYSLYGHCAEFLVEKGDLVKAEEPIAVVGDFGSFKGISLYFEIRFKTKPLNPLQWLKRR
ncbi:MAG: murein hydrolase activator EnvC [Candidatus Aminicenantaceae bacterium]